MSLKLSSTGDHNLTKTSRNILIRDVIVSMSRLQNQFRYKPTSIEDLNLTETSRSIRYIIKKESQYIFLIDPDTIVPRHV